MQLVPASHVKLQQEMLSTIGEMQEHEATEAGPCPGIHHWSSHQHLCPKQAFGFLLPS